MSYACIRQQHRRLSAKSIGGWSVIARTPASFVGHHYNPFDHLTTTTVWLTAGLYSTAVQIGCLTTRTQRADNSLCWSVVGWLCTHTVYRSKNGCVSRHETIDSAESDANGYCAPDRDRCTGSDPFGSHHLRQSDRRVHNTLHLCVFIHARF